MQTNQPVNKPKTSTFEGFFLQMVRPGLDGQCQQMISKFLGNDWQVKPIGDNFTEFEVTLRDDALTPKQAWDKSYELRSQPGVVDAEPLFTVPVPVRKDWDDLLRPQIAAFNQTSIAEESADVTWGLKQMRVFEAWQKYFPDPSKPPGHGIVIAHPDTGYTQHPEIVPNILIDKGINYIQPNSKPLDTLEESGGEIINNPGHGTSTASLVISPPGAQGNYANGKFVVGVAPGAKLLPLRVSYSVVLLGVRNLAEAIEYAADNGSHVITISLGTAFPNQRLRSAILYAQKRGVIIIAAAGTMIPYVVYPAAYDEVIAVTSSNIRREIWWGASRGKQVDVTAPGQELWHAKTRKNDKGEFTYNIEQDSGTSFSAPIVAGLAALWLSYHGRDKLIARYGTEKIPFLFNQLLRDTCEKFPTWKPNRFGAGIVNAEKLLAAPLPDNISQAIASPAFSLQQFVPIDLGELDTFKFLFASIFVKWQTSDAVSIDWSKLKSSLAELLQINENDLPTRLKQVGKELAFYFATDNDLYKQFASILNQQQSPASATNWFQGLFKKAQARTNITPNQVGRSLTQILANKNLSNFFNRQVMNRNK